jgi:hypothetical protein
VRGRNRQGPKDGEQALGKGEVILVQKPAEAQDEGFCNIGLGSAVLPGTSGQLRYPSEPETGNQKLETGFNKYRCRWWCES